MKNQLLFKLVEDGERVVYKDEHGVFIIDSVLASDDYKKSYNAFVYDLHDNKLTIILRRFFNKQYSLFFSSCPGLITRLFSVLFIPFYWVGDRGRILDVGCSTGLFLQYLSDRWEKYGIELNTKAVAIARKQDVNVAACNLESFKSDRLFDVVRISHVLEHVQDYRKFLSIATELLRPNGWLIVYTPNSDSFSRKLTGKFWAGFYDKTHFTIFNAANLIAVAEPLGLEAVFSSSYYMGCLGDSIVRACRIKRGRTFMVCILQILFFPLSFIERLFNKSDAFVVYFKKLV